MRPFEINEKETARKLTEFLKEKLQQSGLTGYVLGLSGGIDSALSAAVGVAAVGPDKIHAIIMPYSGSSASSLHDARLVADFLNLTADTIDISPMIDAYYSDIKTVDPVRAGNKMARERMSILFDKAFQYRSLVLGTSNRTEICLGYGTLFGDVACSVNPLGMLYKTHVRQMAKYYQIPEKILNKIPTADLWPGQTDEDELGMEYAVVDRLLHMMIENNVTQRQKLNDAGFDDRLIDRAVSLLNKNYFKRHLPEIADLGLNPIPDKITIT